MRTLITFFFCLVSAFAQAPVISNIVISAVDHASLNARFNVSTNAYVQIKYGIASGTYIYSSAGYATNAAALSIGGLQPGTTYYLRMTARVNPNDPDTSPNVCLSDACGSPEQTVTTLPEPDVHPIPPQPPVAWNPQEPNTQSYTVIPMMVGSTGECVAAQKTSQQPNWTGTVNPGDNITAILSKISFGTVIEFPQGANCAVLQTDTFWHSGYILPALPLDPQASGNIDSPNHRWIVFRTKQNSAADFPPFGVRTGPQWAPKLAKLIIQTPGMPRIGTPQPGTQNFNGQLFDCYQSGCHHFWWENLEFTHLANSTVYPTNIIDPPAFTDFIRFYPNTADLTVAATTPNYNVIDRVYAHTQPWPARQWTAFSPGGGHWAIINCDIEVNIWRLGMMPVDNAAVANGPSVTIPIHSWGFKATHADATMSAPAIATFTAPSGYTGQFYGFIGFGADKIGFVYQTGNGVSVACSNCTATAQATLSAPFDALIFVVGHLNNGNVSVDYSLPTNPVSDGTTYLPPWRPMAIFQTPTTTALIDNNFVIAAGQTYYNDTDGPHTDEVWTHNYTYFPRSKMQSSPQWDGYTYTFRNVFETKQALRWRIEGNIFDGSAAYQNSGNVLYVAGSYGGAFSTGTQDISMRNNIMKHLSSGFQCAGGGAQAPPDSPTAARLDLSNNIWIDLNRDAYNNGGSGLFSGWLAITPGCEDVNVQNNTVDLTLGPGPALLIMGGAANGATVQGEGLNISNNVVTLSLNALDGMWTLCGQQVAQLPAYPAPICSGTATYKQMLDSSFVRAGQTVVPNYVFNHNVIIGGQTKRSVPNWIDMDQNTINVLSQSFPPGNIFPSGPTLAARRQAIRWDPVGYTVQASSWNAGDIGANPEVIASAAGIVDGISVDTSPNAAQFNYIAPDARACSVDTSADGSAWTRTLDGGGGRPRNLVVPQLTGGTSYQYRIMCYFDQTAAFEFLPSQITSGTFTTPPDEQRVVLLSFPGGMLPGASSVRFTLTPVGYGNAIRQSCPTSPCIVSAPLGSYQRTMEYLDPNGKTLSSPDIATITVR